MRKSADKVTFSVIGLGGRASVYLNALQENYSGRFEVVAVAEPIESKRIDAKNKYGIKDENLFVTDKDLLKRERLSDVAIIGTQDNMHFLEAVALLDKGYDLILEKPISTNLDETLALYKHAQKYPQQVVAICHVLRHTVFFNTLKEIVSSNKLGRVISIQHNENIGYYHFAHSYVRGSWNNSDVSAPLVVAKSCHDMDILLYLLGNKHANKIASFGSLTLFNHNNFNPKTMAHRCIDCSIEKDCPYSAVRIYSSNKIKSVVFDKTSIETVKSQLAISKYGRCVYDCDNNVVDHQATIIEFDDGITATFNISAFTAKVNRSIKIMCEYGEIRGIEKPYQIEYTDFRTDETTHYNLDIAEGGHGGGDKGFVVDFMESYLNGKPFSSTLEKSIESHVMAFMAEKSRVNNGQFESIKEIMDEVNG